MSARTVRTLMPIALLASAVVWFVTDDLPAPGRVMTLVLAAALPPLLLLQGAIPQEDIRGLRPLGVYASSIVLICALGILSWAAGAASGFTAADLGLVWIGIVPGVLWTAGLILFAVAVLALGRALRWRETALLELLLPRTPLERAVFVLLSLAAGVFEELAFRGFLIPALRTASGSTALALALSSVAFGLVHGYQSATGAARAATLGMVLAVPFLVTGSLVPSMAAHALYDVIAGIFLANWALRPTERRH